jgi:hypothetical protein
MAFFFVTLTLMKKAEAKSRSHELDKVSDRQQSKNSV